MNQEKSLITTFLIIFLALSSCGNQKNSDSTKPSSDQESVEALAEPEFNEEDELLGLSEKWTGDLDDIIERGRIRALVPYNRTSYFIDGVKRSGLTFEALNLFEQDLNKKLGKRSGQPGYVQVIFIPVTRDKIIPYLQEGYGDIAAANLAITEKRTELIDFSSPLLSNWNEYFVSGKRMEPLSGINDLTGETVYVRQSSSYFEYLESLNDSLVSVGRPVIQVEFLDESLEDDDILEMVDAGIIPLTIINEFTLNLWEPVLSDIQIHKNLITNKEGKVAWAIRKNSPELKLVLDNFAEKNRQGTLMGNTLMKRYLSNLDYVKKANSSEALARFTKARDLFIKYGEQYDIDFLLLAAQGYQESLLDNSKKNPSGAVGIMQIKPSTAADPNVGINNVYDIENNIHAAAKYLDFIRRRYFSDPQIDQMNAILFSIVAYNMGPAGINRIRKKAVNHGVDPNVWFGQVELLVAREAGKEPVQYLSNIYKYYSSFRSLKRYGESTGRKLDQKNPSISKDLQ